MYFIIKQLDVRGIDWNQVAHDMEITNGHAARMRFARFKNQIEGVQPKAREPRGARAAPRPGPGRPPKTKTEKKEEVDEKDVKTEKKEKKKVKVEGTDSSTADAKGQVELVQPVAAMTIVPKPRIKREADDISTDSGLPASMHPEVEEARQIKKIKSEPLDVNPFEDTKHPEEGADSTKAIDLDAPSQDIDAPGERIDEAELSSLNRTTNLADGVPTEQAVVVKTSASAQSTPVLNNSRLASRSPTSYSHSLPPTPIFNEVAPTPPTGQTLMRQYSVSSAPGGINSMLSHSHSQNQNQHLASPLAHINNGVFSSATRAFSSPSTNIFPMAGAGAQTAAQTNGFNAFGTHNHNHNPMANHAYSVPSSPAPTFGMDGNGYNSQMLMGNAVAMGDGGFDAVPRQTHTPSYTEMLQGQGNGWGAQNQQQHQHQQFFGNGLKSQGGCWDANVVYN